jgi:hypothetical protein
VSFQRRDALADGRLAGAEFLRHQREIQVSHGGGEQLQALQGQELSHQFSLCLDKDFCEQQGRIAC